MTDKKAQREARRAARHAAAEKKAEERHRRREERKRLRREGKVTGACAGQTGARLFAAVNVVFMVMGLVLVALGVYGTSTVWADMFGKGPAYGVMAVGAATCLTAIGGYVGMRIDSKCLLLMYFLALVGSFIVLVTMGCITLFSNDIIDQQFSSWWDTYEAEAVQGQVEFSCCGYNNATDRPAAGACPPGSNSTSLPGCKEKLLEYMNSRFLPLFISALAFGVALFIGIIISSKLICRSTKRKGKRGKKAAHGKHRHKHKHQHGKRHKHGKLDEHVKLQAYNVYKPEMQVEDAATDDEAAAAAGAAV